VVLLFQVVGVLGYYILCTAQEEWPDIISACLPSCHNVSNLVDRCQVGAWWPMYVHCFLIVKLNNIATHTR